jgi:hypothetical protein
VRAGKVIDDSSNVSTKVTLNVIEDFIRSNTLPPAGLRIADFGMRVETGSAHTHYDSPGRSKEKSIPSSIRNPQFNL